MHVKFILPALTEAHGKYWRPIKYSLFPPLGLATLAGYLEPSDHAEIADEHVGQIDLEDTPDLVAIETYITSANRAYAIADSYRGRSIPVVMGGLHVTACPDEALRHADTVVLGPAEEAWPRFLRDFRRGEPQRLYSSRTRDLSSVPPIRRDLIKRRHYLVPNSIVVSRGCPHKCDFCYSNSFFRNGRTFYTYSTQQALEEIRTLPGRHLFFLDDNIFANPTFAKSLFTGMMDMGRIWQGAATIQSLQDTKILDLAAQSGLRSLFVGFESLNQSAMRQHRKDHNRVSQYNRVVESLHERGVMINGSFVFGMDGDDPSVFQRTTEWAISQGIETATFHILTPYPGTDLYARYAAEGRILHTEWDLYDTRHAVFSHPTMTAEAIERGYRESYDEFYKWSGIIGSARTKQCLVDSLRHIVYVGAWKKLDPLWALIIQLRRLDVAIPLLERVLSGRSRSSADSVQQKERPRPLRDTPASISANPSPSR